MRDRVGIAAVSVLLATAVLCAGCGSPVGSPPPATSAAPAVASASPALAESASPALSPDLASTGPDVDVVMDPALIAILPAAVGAAEVEIEPGSFAEAVQDPSFVANVDAAAFAIVTEGNDLASGVVAHLRPDVFSEEFFRDWRDSYDEGACAQAGGVSAHAAVETDSDRTMYVTTCAGGLRVYHAFVPEREVVVSVFSLGERRFGEQLVRGLRP